MSCYGALRRHPSQKTEIQGKLGEALGRNLIRWCRWCFPVVTPDPGERTAPYASGLGCRMDPGLHRAGGVSISRPSYRLYWTQWEGPEGENLGDSSGPQVSPLSVPGHSVQCQHWSHWIFIFLTKSGISLVLPCDKQSLQHLWWGPNGMKSLDTTLGALKPHADREPFVL